MTTDEPFQPDTTATITFTLTLADLNRLRMALDTQEIKVVQTFLPEANQPKWRALENKIATLIEQEVSRQELLKGKSETFVGGYNSGKHDDKTEPKSSVEDWRSIGLDLVKDEKNADTNAVEFWKGYLAADPKGK